MKKWLAGWPLKVGGAVLFVALIGSLYFGLQFLGYMLAVGVFGLFYYFSLQAQREQYLAPKEIEQMKEDLQKLQEEAAFIREHVAEFPNDLDAKLLLRELEKEIEHVQSALPKEE